MLDPENQFFDKENSSKKRWVSRSLAGILLIALLCGVVSAPLAIYIRWQRDQSSQSNELRPAVKAPDTNSESFDGNRIAFIDTDDQLVTIAPNGSNRIELTNDDKKYLFPAWSPNGRALAVVGDDSLYLYPDIDEDSVNNRVVRLYSSPSEPPFYLYWSPDSQQLSFLANHPQGIALLLSSLNEGDSRQLAVGQPFYWDWSPESDQILIHTGTVDEDSSLAVLDASGAQKIKAVANPGRFQAPGVSPSGLQWAYAERTSQGISRIVVQGSDEELLLIEPHSGQAYMTWSPVEDNLAFASPAIGSRSRFGSLRLFEVGTGKTRTIVNEQVVAFFWSPDGSKIAYLTLAEPAPGGIQALDGNKGRLARRIRDQHPEIELNLQIVDIKSREIKWLTTFRPPATYVTQFLPYFDQYALSHLVWSPDGEYLILPMIKGEREVISIITVSDGSVSELAEGKIGFWRPG
ncbi:MAG: PD40 domain-containing protein [Anaerolineae bacterium]|nr:MAG: PD40 domain-containing protein [Anaerolineae bacterium]